MSTTTGIFKAPKKMPHPIPPPAPLYHDPENRAIEDPEPVIIHEHQPRAHKLNTSQS